MDNKPKKSDSWSSLLSDLGIAEPEPVVETEVESTDDSQTENHVEPAEAESAAAAVQSDTRKVGKFGEGILPASPHAKPTQMSSQASSLGKKPTKLSFFDRLASISLFGAGATEKVDRSSKIPPSFESPNEATQSKKLEKVEHQKKTESKPVEPRKTNDPWTNIATQIGVKGQTSAPKQEDPAPVAKTVVEDEIPDIESLVSFRDLPKRMKDTPQKPVAEPLSAEPQPTVSKERYSGDSKRNNRENRDGRGSNESRKRGGERYSEPSERDNGATSSQSSRGRAARFVPEATPSIEELNSTRRSSGKKGQRNYDKPREDLEMTPVYGESMELEDLDLIAPVAGEDNVPTYSLGEIEDDEQPILPPKKSRFKDKDKRQTRGRKTHGERFQPPVENEFDDEIEDVLVPLPEREYGPSRDVFAEIIPDDSDGPREVSEAELSWESPPSKPGRGSKWNASKRPVHAKLEPEIDEPEPVYKEKIREPRQKDSRRPVAKSRIPDDESMDERDENEEREMIQLHKSIPSWDDAVLPVVESNIARHESRRNDSPRRSKRPT